MVNTPESRPELTDAELSGTRTISFRIQTLLYKRWMADAKSKGQGIKDYLLHQLDPESDAIKIVEQVTADMDVALGRMHKELLKERAETKKLRQELKQLQKEKQAAEKKKISTPMAG